MPFVHFNIQKSFLAEQVEEKKKGSKPSVYSWFLSKTLSHFRQGFLFAWQSSDFSSTSGSSYPSQL